MVAIGRALMAEPSLLALDEPSFGLAPILVEQFYATIRQIREQGTTILLSEQNAGMALAVADRGYVLQKGVVRTEGRTEDLRRSDEVRAAYLGA
jgi:branched-chain amino acid transport system ATP-binding protein